MLFGLNISIHTCLNHMLAEKIELDNFLNDMSQLTIKQKRGPEMNSIFQVDYIIF